MTGRTRAAAWPQDAAAGLQDAGHLVEVVVEVSRQHVGEDRDQEDAVEGLRVVGEGVLARLAGPVRVVAAVEDVGALEAERA